MYLRNNTHDGKEDLFLSITLFLSSGVVMSVTESGPVRQT